jgi:NitT/TauT family transport system substrate-binding protein
MLKPPLTRTPLIAASALLLGAAGWWLARNGGSPAGKRPHIVLGAEPVPAASPLWVAEQNGYFGDEGVDVEIREFDSGRTALFTLAEKGGLDMATAAQTPVVAKSFGRSDYAIVACMMSSDNDVKLLARRDRGVASAQDLKGKTIGITSGSSGHFFLSLFLNSHQLQMSDVTLRDLEPARLGDALIAGDVDAVATWEPHIHKARQALGDQAALLPSGNVYREDFYFIARKTFIRQEQEALRRFLKAIEKGQHFIHQHQAAAMDIVQRRLKIERKTLEATWNELQFGLTLDQSVLDALDDEARWALQNRLADAKQIPNYLDYLHTDALLSVKPEAVTVAGVGSGAASRAGDHAGAGSGSAPPPERPAAPGRSGAASRAGDHAPQHAEGSRP